MNEVTGLQSERGQIKVTIETLTQFTVLVS